jgi:hypothetical protein
VRGGGCGVRGRWKMEAERAWRRQFGWVFEGVKGEWD